MNFSPRSRLSLALFIFSVHPASAQYLQQLASHPELSAHRGHYSAILSLREAEDAAGLLELVEFVYDTPERPAARDAKTFVLAQCALALKHIGHPGEAVEILGAIREMRSELGADEFRYLIDLGIAALMAQQGHRSHPHGFNPHIDEKAEAFGRIFREYYPYHRYSLTSEFAFVDEAKAVRRDDDLVAYGAYTVHALRVLQRLEQRVREIQEHPRLASDRTTFEMTDYYLERIAELRPKLERRLDALWENVSVEEEAQIVAEVAGLGELLNPPERDWVAEFLAIQEVEPADLEGLEDWVEYALQPFTFSGPSNLVDVLVQGIDSLVWRYNLEGRFELNLGYGSYGTDFSGAKHHSGYSESTITVDHRRGIVYEWYTDTYDVYPHIVALYLPEVGPKNSIGVPGMTMIVNCKTPADRKYARQLFDTIRIHD